MGGGLGWVGGFALLYVSHITVRGEIPRGLALGMLLGVRLYYQFCGVVLESEVAFEGKVDELCRELGERGKA